MIKLNDIKEAVDQFKDQNADALSDRDIAGLNKIHFELDLLAPHEQKKSKKKPLATPEEPHVSESSGSTATTG